MLIHTKSWAWALTCPLWPLSLSSLGTNKPPDSLYWANYCQEWPLGLQALLKRHHKHTYTQTAYTHKNSHTLIHVNTHTNMHIHIDTYHVHRYRHICTMHILIYTASHSPISRMQTLIYRYSHAYPSLINSRIYAYTHVHTYSYSHISQILKCMPHFFQACAHKHLYTLLQEIKLN